MASSKSSGEGHGTSSRETYPLCPKNQEINLPVGAVMPAIHKAAEAGSIKDLQFELWNLNEDEDILQVYNGRTVLHYAAEYQDRKVATNMIKEILGCDIIVKNLTVEQKLIDTTIHDTKDTALHIAAANYNRPGVIELLERGADVEMRNKKGFQQVDLIYKNVPKAIKEMFDKKIKLTKPVENVCPDDEALEVEVDFSVFVGIPRPEDQHKLNVETNLIKPALDKGYKDLEEIPEILGHPVTELFLYYKFEKIKWVIGFSIGIHIFWSLCCAVFFLGLYLWDCPHNFSNSTTGEPVSCTPGAITQSSSIILFVMSIAMVIKEGYEIYKTTPKKMYLAKENIGQWVLILPPLCIIIVRWATNFAWISEWEYCLASVSALFAFALILAQLRKIPGYGIYMEMLQKVVERSFYFLGVYGCLLVAFWASFAILLPKKEEFQYYGFVKHLTFLIGEANYDDLFYDEKAEQEVPFPAFTQFMFVILILVVPVVLLGLLIGILVNDVMALREEGRISSTKTQLREINLLETFLLKTFPIGRLQEILVVKQNLVVPPPPVRQTSQSEMEEPETDTWCMNCFSSSSKSGSETGAKPPVTDGANPKMVTDGAISSAAGNSSSAANSPTPTLGQSSPPPASRRRRRCFDCFRKTKEQSCPVNLDDEAESGNANVRIVKLCDEDIPLAIRKRIREKIKELYFSQECGTRSELQNENKS